MLNYQDFMDFSSFRQFCLCYNDEMLFCFGLNLIKLAGVNTYVYKKDKNLYFEQFQILRPKLAITGPISLIPNEK